MIRILGAGIIDWGEVPGASKSGVLCGEAPDTCGVVESLAGGVPVDGDAGVVGWVSCAEEPGKGFGVGRVGDGFDGFTTAFIV